jgi:hypothetical protein
MKVLVCGGRDYSDRALLRGALGVWHRRHPITRIIHGGAPGADTMAGEWALENDIRCDVYPADWERYGRRAGPLRNKRMLREAKPDLVMAFPGGRGTLDMVRRAGLAGVRVVHQPSGR